MRITQEADYALRMVSLMAQSESVLGAASMADAVAVPPRFAVKILRKLSQYGLVHASRGVTGGYRLAVDPLTLTVRQVIEAIDGPTYISRCLSEGHVCLNNSNKTCCRFHSLFGALNTLLTERLDRVTIGMMVDTSLPLEDLLLVVK